MFQKYQLYFLKKFEIIKRISEHKLIRHSIRAVRVGFISILLYSTGYNSGLLDYAQDPIKMDNKLLEGILSGTNATGVLNNDNEYSIRANKIGKRIIASAISYVNFNINSLKNSNNLIDNNNTIVKTTGGTTIPNINYKKKYNDINLITNENNNEIKLIKWKKIQKKLLKLENWEYIVTNSNEINAFVTDLLPRRIFINKGLFDSLKPSDDELSIILGHEISHLLLDHVPDNMQFEAILLGIQLIIFSFVDPTGIGSFLFDSICSKLRSYLNAGKSRQCELEADALAVTIAGRACFNVKDGIKIMDKLHNMDNIHYTIHNNNENNNKVKDNKVNNIIKIENKEEYKEENNLLKIKVPHRHTPSNWSDTHPTFESRIELLQTVHDEFASNHRHTSHCQDVRDDLSTSFHHILHKIQESVPHV